MDNRLVKRGYGDYHPVAGFKFLRDRTNCIDRVHGAVIVGTMIVGDFHIISGQPGNGSAGNGPVYDAGAIPVENDTTRGNLPDT